MQISETTPDDDSSLIVVLAVDDFRGHDPIYRSAFQNADDIVYLGLINHDEARGGSLPAGRTWHDISVVLLDMGARVGQLNSADDEWPGLLVATAIRRATNDPKRPWVAAITRQHSSKTLRERARANGGLNEFRDRDETTLKDDGEELRALVRSGHRGEFLADDDAVPDAIADKEIEEFRGLLKEDASMIEALEAGATAMRLYRVSLLDYIAPPKAWSAQERRNKLDPVTKAVREHFKVRPQGGVHKTGKLVDRYQIDLRGIQRLYKLYYTDPDRDWESSP